MTQNQKFLKLGTGTPTDKVRRRMEKRGVDYLRPFRSRHEAAMVRSAARTHLRKLEEAKRRAAQKVEAQRLMKELGLDQLGL